MNISGKNVVITGGAMGIGLEIIKECLNNNASNVAILDLADPNNVLDELTKKYPKQNIYLFTTDVTNVENVKKSFSLAIEKFQFIDIVIGNAGILNESLYEKTIQVNLLGMMHSTYAALDLMSKKNGGRGGFVINIASVMGLDYSPVIPAYVASKHGVIGLTRSFGDDFHYNLHGVKFMAICPGFTSTNIIADIDTKLINEESAPVMDQTKETKTLQTPNLVASNLIDIIKLNKNGSIWIIDDGKHREVVLTKYWDFD